MQNNMTDMHDMQQYNMQNMQNNMQNKMQNIVHTSMYWQVQLCTGTYDFAKLHDPVEVYSLPDVLTAGGRRHHRRGPAAGARTDLSAVRGTARVPGRL